MDDMKQYRAMCANRVRRLERFKKTHSFCSLDQETTMDSDYASSAEPECPPVTPSVSHFFPSSSASTSDDDESSTDTFNMIKEKMIALMEDDVSLLQQLVTLSEKISEVKKGRGLLPLSLSQTSIHGEYDEEDDDRFDDDNSHCPRFAKSVSAITTLYLDEETCSSSKPPPQYFSRKNSVLRIPIPPRASNRINRRPSDMSRHQRPLHVDPPSSSNLCIISGPTRLSSPLARSPSSPLSTTSSACSTVSSASGHKILPTVIPKTNRASSSSNDSGRASDDSSDSSSPTPHF